MTCDRIEHRIAFVVGIKRWPDCKIRGWRPLRRPVERQKDVKKQA